MTSMPYRYVGQHLDDLADGRQLEPGGFYELDPAQPHNRRLIDDGLLVATGSTINATAAAVEFAGDHRVSLADVAGTGRRGEITKADVESHIAKKEEQA